MKKLRIISILALVVAVFLNIDLGINCIGALIPEFQDGIPFNSVLQSWFGIWERQLKTRIDFFKAFQNSLWITYVIFFENMVLSIISILKSKNRFI